MSVTNTPRLLFLFVDGVGLGAPGPENPFSVADMPFLEGLLGGRLELGLNPVTRSALVFRSLDATLGTAGLPQSATGQTALLTGKNGADIMGRHYGPWPGPTLKRVLDKGTLFSEVLTAGLEAQLANVYPPGYFQALARKKLRANVPVYAARAAGLGLPSLTAYRQGRAVSVDLTGEHLRRYDEHLNPLTPRESGQRLARLSGAAHFTFFDYWPSDDAGHRADFAEAAGLLERLDTFLAGVVDALETTLLLTSDHGNLEDKSVKTHTRAPVPLLALGPGAEHFAELGDILDVTPAVRRLLSL